MISTISTGLVYLIMSVLFFVEISEFLGSISMIVRFLKFNFNNVNKCS